MTIFTQIAGLLLSLSILVILHEAGHFVFAKLFNTRVEKFYLFFNPWFSLFKFKKGETEYGIGWLPLGGYVKIAGMIDESMDKEQLKKPPQPWEFRAKPAWQRLLIMTGGVLVNFILALAIFAMILFAFGREYIPVQNLNNGVVWDSLALKYGLQNGDKVIKIGGQEISDFSEISKQIVTETPETITVIRDGRQQEVSLPDDFVQQMIANDVKTLAMPAFPFIIDSVMPDMPAEEAGFKKGDKIVEVNGTKTEYAMTIIQKIQQNKGKKIDMKVLRHQDTTALTVKVAGKGVIGIYNKPFDYYIDFAKEEYGFVESIPAGISLGVNTLVGYVKQMKHVFTKEGAQSIGGFGTIGGLFPQSWDWARFWELTALLSIILAFMNILPIPALDGGHVLFLLYEIVTGRRPGEKFLEYAQITGMVILLALLLYANGLDLIRGLSD